MVHVIRGSRLASAAGTTTTVLCAVALCSQFGAAAQQRTLVEVSGRTVEIVRMGQGSPTLILESGGGEAAAQWARILPELARHTQVIAYSRSGFGNSSPGPMPGSPQASVTELRQLLQMLGETRPVVIAGHSWGGLLARLYVSTYPGDVAGVVLVDGTHEQQTVRWERMFPGFKFADFMRAYVARARPATRDVYEQFIAIAAAQRVEGMKPLPDIPLAVITAAEHSCPLALQGLCTPAGLEMKRELHAEWAIRSTASVHYVSARSGHYVMNDQPELMVDALKFVLAQVRAASGAVPPRR